MTTEARLAYRVQRSLSSYFQTLGSFNRDVRLYLFASALFGFAIFGGIYTTLLNLYLLRLGYGPDFVGVINGVGQLVFGLCALPIGILGRYITSRRLLIMSMILIVVGNGLLPLAEFVPVSQTGWLIGMQIIAQIGFALYFVHGAPFVMQVAPAREHNHIFAATIAIWPLSGFVGSLVGGILPEYFASTMGLSLDEPAPYQYALMVAALIMILGVIAMVRTRGGKINPHFGFQTPTTKYAPIGVLAAIFAAVLLRVVGEGVVRTFLNIYLDDGLQMTVVNIGLLLGVGQLLAVPAALAFPLFAGRWGANGIYLACAIGMAISFIPMAFVSHWAVVGLSYMTVIALLSLARPAIVAVQLNAVTASWHTVMTGTTSTAVGLGWALASLTGGFLVTNLGYPSLFIASAAMTGAGALVFWLYFGARSAPIT